jgi:hypothetical protein
MRASSRSPFRSARRTLPLLAAAGLAACGDSSSGGSSFAITTTTRAAAPSAPLVVTGDWIVYFASEGFSGAGTDLTVDGDTVDQVAHAVDTRTRVETNLMAAAADAKVVGEQVYLVVDETLDNRDWSGTGGIGDFVLLHWTTGQAMPAFVDVLDAAGGTPIALDDHLYYVADGAVVGTDATNLRVLAEAAPTTPVEILNTAGEGPVGLHLLEEIDGLVFLGIDENANALDFNGDLDTVDEQVLALLDGTDVAGRVKNVGLALSDIDRPLAARVLGANDWLAAFLVDEAAQGENLNDQTLFTQPLLPENCIGTPDGDMLDAVLHYVELADFLAGTAMPVNTGLAAHSRIVLLEGFVATISDETDANCNLNADTGDADMTDDVVRWVATTLPVAPHVEKEDLHAISPVPGGSMGLAVLDDRLVAVIDEASDSANHDGKVLDHELVAWIDPAAATPTWDFTHQNPSNPSWGTGVFDDDGDPEPFAGTTWMGAEQIGDRLPVVFLEEVPGTNPDVGSLNTNVDCAFVQKDTDKNDGLPVWADFESGPTLDFDGVGFAVDEGNAGIEIAAGFAFFRVSEAKDNRDYNADGDLGDVVLFRNPLTTCGPVAMATASTLPGQVIVTDRLRSVAFLSSEQQAGIDFNADGDMTDIVVRWFRL